MSEGEPEYLKHLTAEEIATVAHGAITTKNRQIHNLQKRIRELESERDIFARTLDKRDAECAEQHRVIDARNIRIRELEAERDRWEQAYERVEMRAIEAGELHVSVLTKERDNARNENKQLRRDFRMLLRVIRGAPKVGIGGIATHYAPQLLRHWCDQLAEKLGNDDGQ